MSDYYSGQGRILIAKRDSATGALSAFRKLLDVSDFKCSFKTEVKKAKEHESGFRLTAKQITTGKDGTFSFTVTQFTKENYALALHGASSVVAAGTVTAGTPFPVGLVAGDSVGLDFMRVSAVVLKDSAATPATLVLGTNYKVASPDHGTVEMVNVGSFVQPFIPAYAYAAHNQTTVFTSQAPEFSLRYESVNTSEGNKPVLWQFYSCTSEPLNDLSLITDDFGGMQISGTMLADTSKPVDGSFGQFGFIKAAP